ncbi:MAG: hypothetical protein PHN39_01785 [Candidatus Pacebacteria bacterium]|nr:hypothetical protein [Candidatus Paceibacterota bacterium]
MRATDEVVEYLLSHRTLPDLEEVFDRYRLTIDQRQDVLSVSLAYVTWKRLAELKQEVLLFKSKTDSSEDAKAFEGVVGNLEVKAKDLIERVLSENKADHDAIRADIKVLDDRVKKVLCVVCQLLEKIPDQEIYDQMAGGITKMVADLAKANDKLDKQATIIQRIGDDQATLIHKVDDINSDIKYLIGLEEDEEESFEFEPKHFFINGGGVFRLEECADGSSVWGSLEGGGRLVYGPFSASLFVNNCYGGLSVGGIIKGYFSVNIGAMSPFPKKYGREIYPLAEAVLELPIKDDWLSLRIGIRVYPWDNRMEVKLGLGAF